MLQAKFDGLLEAIDHEMYCINQAHRASVLRASVMSDTKMMMWDSGKQRRRRSSLFRGGADSGDPSPRVGGHSHRRSSSVGERGGGNTSSRGSHVSGGRRGSSVGPSRRGSTNRRPSMVSGLKSPQKS
uniref:Uncharacterized protein n=1 Tax=Eutreptiella gymnastica TaxID=73025 RepID=A0A7S4GFD5_9EUGL